MYWQSVEEIREELEAQTIALPQYKQIVDSEIRPSLELVEKLEDGYLAASAALAKVREKVALIRRFAHAVDTAQLAKEKRHCASLNDQKKLDKLKVEHAQRQLLYWSGQLALRELAQDLQDTHNRLLPLITAVLKKGERVGYWHPIMNEVIDNCKEAYGLSKEMTAEGKNVVDLLVKDLTDGGGSSAMSDAIKQLAPHVTSGLWTATIESLLHFSPDIEPRATVAGDIQLLAFKHPEMPATSELFELCRELIARFQDADATTRRFKAEDKGKWQPNSHARKLIRVDYKVDAINEAAAEEERIACLYERSWYLCRDKQLRLARFIRLLKPVFEAAVVESSANKLASSEWIPSPAWNNCLFADFWLNESAKLVRDIENVRTDAYQHDVIMRASDRYHEMTRLVDHNQLMPMRYAIPPLR